MKKEILFSAVKDMFLNNSYEEYSIGDCYTVSRHKDAKSWEDEGFRIRNEEGESVCIAYAGDFVENEETFVFDLGGSLNVMVNEAALMIGCEDVYDFIANEYYPEDIIASVDSGDLTKDEAVDAAVDEIESILTDWFENDWGESEWFGIAVPMLQGYLAVIKNSLGVQPPMWIKEDVLKIQSRWEEK